MCVILTCETSRPSLDVLQQCETDNPHGGGMAWRDKSGKIMFKKGITAKEIHEISLQVELPFVIHFRIATAGGMSPEMCHPFPVGGSTRMHGKVNAVVFHNGHWHEWEDTLLSALVSKGDRRLPSGNISDTRAIALLVSWYGPNVLTLIKGQKFVYFDKHTCDVKGYGWTSHNGIQFSNMYWYSKRQHQVAGYSGYNGNAGYAGRSGYWDANAKRWVDYDDIAKEVRDKKITANTSVFNPANPDSGKDIPASHNGVSTALSPYLTPKLGVSEEEIAELERRYGINVEGDEQLVIVRESETRPAEEKEEKVVVGTFGENAEPITVKNS